MTDATDRLTLAADFPPASRPQWLALVEQLLKGAPFERTLVARTHDGLTARPPKPESLSHLHSKRSFVPFGLLVPCISQVSC